MDTKNKENCKRKGLRALNVNISQNFEDVTKWHLEVIDEFYTEWVIDKHIRLFWKTYSKKLMQEFNFIKSRFDITYLFGEVIFEYKRVEPYLHSLTSTKQSAKKLFDLLHDRSNENALIDGYKNTNLISILTRKYPEFSLRLKADLEDLLVIVEKATEISHPSSQIEIDKYCLNSAVKKIHNWWKKNTRSKYTIEFHRDESAKKDISTRGNTHAGAKHPLVPVSEAARFTYELLVAADRVAYYVQGKYKEIPEHQPFQPPKEGMIDDNLSRRIKNAAPRVKKQIKRKTVPKTK